MGDKQVNQKALNDVVADDNQKLASMYDADVVSQEELNTLRAHERARPKDSDYQRGDREAAMKNMQGDTGGSQPTVILMQSGNIMVGDPEANISFGKDTVETNIGDPSNPGITFSAKSGSEVRTGGGPLQRDTTTDKDIYVDGKARNRKEAFGPNHIVDPYPPLLSSAPVWMQGAMRGALAAIVVILKEMQEAEK